MEKTVEKVIRKRRMTQREMHEEVTKLWNKLKSNMVDLKSGSLLPSENELFKKYRCSRAVIRNLYRKLQDEGIVRSEDKLGFFLTDKFHKQFDESKKYNLSIAVVAYIDYKHPNSPHSSATILLSSFEKQGAKFKSQSRLFNMYDYDGVNLETLEKIKEYRPDAILYQNNISVDNDACVQYLKLLDCPIVTVGTCYNNINSIVFDHEQIITTALEHLHEKGRGKLAMIQQAGDSFWQVERRDKFSEICPDGKVFLLNSPGIDPEAVERMRSEIVPELLKGGYDGVVGSGDEFAALLIDILKEQDCKIPEDIAIVGIDDMWSYRHYDLTTIQLSYEKTGVEVFEFLSDLVQGKCHESHKKRVKCPLLIRSTT